MTERELHIHESVSSPEVNRVKAAPQSKSIPVPFFYAPSDDGTDENLLILLHGLGDTHTPFAKLGQSLKLPQTAILSLRGTEQIPYLYEDRYQWYTSFDELGDVLEHPNPTPALDIMSKTMHHLINDCAWHPSRIHLFGFAQGGSVVAEFAIRWWKEHASDQLKGSFSSVVIVSGPFLSYPTLSELSTTPVLVVHRPSPADLCLSSAQVREFKKGFRYVQQVALSGSKNGMPASKDEWEPIMRFWSEKLGKRRAEGLYEVMTGQS